MFDDFKGGLGGSFGAFDLSTPHGAVDLALRILSTAEDNHEMAVAMAHSIRDTTIGILVATALITQAQRQEKPIIALSEDDIENPQPHTPAEILEPLIEAFRSGEDSFETMAEVFRESVDRHRMEDALAEVPDNFTVDDILNAGKDEE